MEEKAFAKLIDQYLNGQLSDADKRKVDNWLDNLAEKNAIEPVSETEQEAVKNHNHAQLFKRINFENKPVSSAKILWLKPYLKIASCMVLAGILIYGFQVQLKEIFNIGQYTSVTNTKGRITKSILADGSIVWLKGNSKLCFPVKFKGSLRVVELHGEALFEVAKDAGHPFIIHSGALTTRVLGTSFNIKQGTDKTIVTVLTGHVFLSSKNVAALSLLPYQKGLFNEHQKVLVKEAQPGLQVAELTKGTEYEMLFNDAILDGVIRRIEQKFEVKITLENPELNKNLVTADLTDQSLTNSMEMICGALNLDYNINGRAVTIRKQKQQK